MIKQYKETDSIISIFFYPLNIKFDFCCKTNIANIRKTYKYKENFVACREEEGIQLINEMKKRFSATVNTTNKSNILMKNIDSNSMIELVSQIIFYAFTILFIFAL